MAAHSLAHFIFKYPILSYRWNKRSNYLALLSVPDEQDLIQLIGKLKSSGIRHAIFQEPDLDNQITAVAIEPGPESKNICAGLPLALKEFSSNGINKHKFKTI